MKKIVFTLITIILLVVNVSASTNCNVVSGTGKNIGDEIACGTEHFYVMESNNGNVKMMAKYNLYVGANYNKILLDITKTYIKYECAEGICNLNPEYYYNGEKVNVHASNYENEQEWKNKIKQEYNINYLIDNNDVVYYESENHPGAKAIIMYNYGEKYTIDDKIYQNVTYKIYPYTAISESTEGYALQNKKALGVTGEKGNANYPINAVMILISGYNLQREYVDALNEKINILDNYETGYTDIEFKDNTYIKKYLDDYSIKLNNMGYEVSNTNIMSIKELNDLIYNISKRNLPLSDWYNASQNTSFSEEEIRYGTLGDLKDYLSNDYSWIWNTTYWMRTLKGNITEGMEYFPEGYFVSSAGEICYINGDCYQGIPRAGIRPVVTIPTDNITYPHNIETETDGNGQIEVVDKAYEDETITFRISPKPNYKISSITLVDSSGNEVTYTEDQIINNDDGTISINSFIMPGSDVKISATFTYDYDNNPIINPKTGISYPIGLIVISLIISGISLLWSDKKSISLE